MDDKARIQALELAVQGYSQALAEANAKIIDLRVELTLERAKAAQATAAKAEDASDVDL